MINNYYESNNKDKMIIKIIIICGVLVHLFNSKKW